ncbi:hypothetical protein QYE76_033182 [Lolium multiflorum]|uniref:Uncharacterized protein n=1 Tax=Lolium multiflorum TaxID=4521 RepID=A0AAD8QY88_LOLMU|nr:hypothetical protein QYE76_033182 [Lolium multiflorum]
MAVFEARRVLIEEKKALMDLIVLENKAMLMDHNAMDALTREWWELSRRDILEQRRQAVGRGGCAPASGGTFSGHGGGVGRASGELGDNGVD